MEPHTQRFEPQMPKYVPIIPPQKYDHFHRVYYDDIKDTLQYENSMVLSELNKNDELECFTDCNEEDLCQSWSYDSVAGVCYMFSDVRMNGHMDGAFSGVKVRLNTLSYYYLAQYRITTYAFFICFACVLCL